MIERINQPRAIISGLTESILALFLGFTLFGISVYVNIRGVIYYILFHDMFNSECHCESCIRVDSYEVVHLVERLAKSAGIELDEGDSVMPALIDLGIVRDTWLQRKLLAPLNYIEQEQTNYNRLYYHVINHPITKLHDI